MHTQFRDPQTGLFPLTLLTEKFSHGPDSPLYEEQKGENGNTENKTHRRRTIEEVRQNFSGLVEWAGGVCREVRNERKENKTHHTHKINEREKEFYENFYCQSLLAKFYVKPGISNTRGGTTSRHTGKKILQKCNIKGLKIPKENVKCDPCVQGKIHRLGHTSKSGKENIYLPGECIHTDLQGPWVRSRGGGKYSQIFIDLGSRRLWTVRLGKKTDSDEAIRKILTESKIRSGRTVKFLRTDGDGIFGRSESFKKLQEDLGFIHQRPAPYDHEQNALIDRECRTLLESVSTSLSQSGCPPSFWGDAVSHYIYTRNNIPKHDREKRRKNIYFPQQQVGGGGKSVFSQTPCSFWNTVHVLHPPPLVGQAKSNPVRLKEV